jgi:hypothetical protein
LDALDSRELVALEEGLWLKKDACQERQKLCKEYRMSVTVGF